MKKPIGRLDPAIKTVHIWGGGFAGLLMGHFLSKQGFSIELYEKSARLGGKIGTDKAPSGLVEWGPNAVFATEDIQDWLRDLKLNPVPARKKLRRWIWLDGLSPVRKRDIFRRILPRLINKAPPLTSKTTVADFFLPLIGRKTIENLLSPGLQGVYGTSADQLTVLSLWPHLEGTALPFWKVLTKIKGPKAKSVSFRNGMQELVNALAASINGNIHLNYPGPFKLEPNTIITTDAHTAAVFLQDYPTAAKPLSSIQYLPIASATLHSSIRLPWSESGFGVLFPKSQAFNTLGCLFNHSIFPGRIQQRAQTSMTFIMSGVPDAEKAVAQDLSHMDCPQGDLYQKYFHYPLGLPLYNEARWSAIQALHQSKALPNSTVLFGNYVAGISLRDMINAASSFAKDLGVE